MALIRHSQAKELAREAFVLDLGDLQRQADELKARAEAEARAIILEAREERERILEGSHKKGFSEGRAAGHAQGLEEGRVEGRAEAEAEYRDRFEQVSVAMESALSEFERSREDLVLHAQEDGLRLVLDIAQRVTRRAVAVDRDGLGERVGEAVRRVIDPSRLVVRVHPDDEAMAREALDGLMSRFDNTAHAEVRADAALRPGDAVVSGGRGEIDATIGSQLDRMINELMPRTSVDDGGDGVSP